MDTSKSISIPLSKSKLIWIVLVCILFAVAGVFFWTISDSQSQYPPILIKLVSISSIAFCSVCGIFGLVKLFDNKPGLTIDPTGIDDSSSGGSVGHIPWSDITGIDIKTIGGQNILTIFVLDPSKYVERINFLKRKANEMNSRLYGSPVQISSNTLKIDFSQLTQLVQQYYDKYKK